MAKSAKLTLYNQRILTLLEEYKKEQGITQKETWLRVGLNANNASSYKSGLVGFSIENMLTVCKLTGVSSDWILGLSKEKYQLKVKEKDPAKVIKEALKQLEGGK
jgi:hypothetical protein